MSDILFEVKHSAGTISTNFDNVKKYIEDRAKQYEGLIVTEESRVSDKKTVAELRKLRKSIDDSRKDVKKQWMQPYLNFEETVVKELLSIVDKPIDFINGQVEEFERKRLEEKERSIQLIYDAEIGDMKDFLPLYKIRDEKWNNSATTLKSIRKEMSELIDKIRSEVESIKQMQSDAVPDALKLYATKLNMAEAIAHINAYEKQRQDILKREEAQRIERAERERQAEFDRIRMEERRRIEEEERIRQKALADVKTVNEELAAPLKAQNSRTVVYTVVASDEEIKNIEMAFDSLGIYFERKDV